MSREKDIKRLFIYLLVFVVLNQANQWDSTYLQFVTSVYWGPTMCQLSLILRLKLCLFLTATWWVKYYYFPFYSWKKQPARDYVTCPRLC